MAVLLKCPACREKFRYDVTNGWPDLCPICNTDINNRVPDNVVVMPAFLSQKTKSNDKVARDIMDGSEARVDMAAAMAGTSWEDMAGSSGIFTALGRNRLYAACYFQGCALGGSR